MRYILPKADIFEEMILSTEGFFRENQIDVSNMPMALYNEFYCSLIINALDYILSWQDLPVKEVNKTLNWIYSEKRKYRQGAVYYNYDKAEDHMALAIGRFKVQMEKRITIDLGNQHSLDLYSERLMEKYYYFVLDSVDLQIKNLLQSIIGKDTWNVFELVSTGRTLELVEYGDFRILTWEMNRTKR